MYPLHNSHNCRLNAEASRVIVLLLRLSSLTVTLNLVAAADDTNLDLDKLALEALVEREAVARFDIFRHGLFDQYTRLGRHRERLQVPDQIVGWNVGPGLDLLKSQ